MTNKKRMNAMTKRASENTNGGTKGGQSINCTLLGPFVTRSWVAFNALFPFWQLFCCFSIARIFFVLLLFFFFFVDSCHSLLAVSLFDCSQSNIKTLPPSSTLGAGIVGTAFLVCCYPMHIGTETLPNTTSFIPFFLSNLQTC